MPSMISRKRKWVFLHPMRTGGTSITLALQDLFDDREGVSPHDASPKATKHCRLWIFDIDPKEYFKFMIIRNPWARCASISSYHKSRGEYHGMDRAIGCGLPFALYDLADMDHVLRTEHLGADFAVLCSKLGIKPRGLRRVNKVPHAPYQEYYNKKTKRLVRKRYAYTIGKFGYTFD